MSKPPPGEWANRAACKNMDPDWFLPEDHTPFPPEARAACRGCEVRQACLEYALSPPWERRGLWGGTGPRERRDISRERQRRGAA